MPHESEDPERIVKMLYKAVLRRDADHDGLVHYSNRISSGSSVVSVMEEFLNSEEFKALSRTPLFVPPGHFYSPIVDVEEAKKYLSKQPSQPPRSLPGIEIDHLAMVDLWLALVPYMKSSPFADERKEGYRYAFDNNAYAWGDGSILHGVIRHFTPKRIIEIGSGWSSACTLDTVQHYMDGQCDIQFIEPHPKLLYDLIGDGGPLARNIKVHENFVQDVPLEVFDDLEAGDFLFIDSTHIVKSGSDCCFEFFDVMSRVKPGVIVHIHDMFWPFEYPAHWIVDENRSWNEIYAVRALLTDNPNWEIIMFNDYMARLERDLVERTFPTFLKGAGAALWLVRK